MLRLIKGSKRWSIIKKRKRIIDIIKYLLIIISILNYILLSFC